MKLFFNVGAFSTVSKTLSAIAVLLLACNSARATLFSVTATGPGWYIDAEYCVGQRYNFARW